MSPLVSVVILNWNGIGFLERFLPLIVERTPKDMARIVVADNGSTDRSASYVKEHFPEVELILFDKNYGFTGGYNRALSRLDTKYYVLLNSDVEVSVHWLEPLVAMAENDSRVAAVMPKILSFNDKTRFEYAGAGGGFIDWLGYPFCRGRILSILEHDNGQYDEPRGIFWASGACMLVRADLYHRYGGLDEDFFAHMEEIDFCWRLKNGGYQIMAEPSSVVLHVGGGTLPNESPRKLYLNFRNNLFMLYKNLPKQKLFPVLFCRMVLDGVAALIYLFKGKGKNALSVCKAHADFYKNLALLKRKREACPPGNKEVSAIYRKSILLTYTMGKRHFQDLDPGDFTV